MAASTGAYGEFVAFMADYTAFLKRFCTDEKSRLSAMSGQDLAQIQSSIVTSQANAKQMENYEAKRIALQGAAGYKGLSFRQLINLAPAQQQAHLWELFTSFENAVAEIRFYNDKSMAAARDNMLEKDPGYVLPGMFGTKAANPYEKIMGEQAGQSTVLKTKV